MLIRLAIGATLAVGSILYGAIDYESHAGKPWGKMCNSVFTGFVDTCPDEVRPFALLALVNLPHGQTDAYVIDSGLTADDCRIARVSPLPADLPASLVARLGKARITCEMESE